MLTSWFYHSKENIVKVHSLETWGQHQESLKWPSVQDIICFLVEWMDPWNSELFPREIPLWDIGPDVFYISFFCFVYTLEIQSFRCTCDILSISVRKCIFITVHYRCLKWVTLSKRFLWWSNNVTIFV
jgi:hypothetical protein